MDTANMTGMLGFGTLLIALIIGVVLWAKFMRKPENRHPTRGKQERNIQEIQDDLDASPLIDEKPPA